MSDLKEIMDPVLLQAVNGCNIEEVKRLVSEGKDVNARDANGYTPLHLVIEKCSTDKVKALLQVEEIDVNVKGKNEDTPLHWAADSGNKDKVKALLEVKGIDVNAKDNDGGTPLHWAAQWGKKDTVEALLQVEGIDVNAEDNYGYAPLFFAAQWGKKDVVDALLEVLGIEVNAKNKGGHTPWDLARNEQIKLLLKNADDGSTEEPSTTPSDTTDLPLDLFKFLFIIILLYRKTSYISLLLPHLDMN